LEIIERREWKFGARILDFLFCFMRVVVLVGGRMGV